MNVYFFFMKKCDHLIHFGLILALLQMKMFDSSDPLKGFNTYKLIIFWSEKESAWFIICVGVLKTFSDLLMLACQLFIFIHVFHSFLLFLKFAHFSGLLKSKSS